MRIIKKITLLLLTLLLAMPLLAEKVSQRRAAEVAAEFFGTPVKRGGAELTVVENSSNAWAAFNREGGGFVVIALNDAVSPVLAYSPDGRFPDREEMPDGMAWWFSQLEVQLNSLSDDATPTKAVRAQWDNPAPTRGGSVLYETASWDQHEPFNYHCPMLNGQRCITGCVAIAGAILARYFQWPDAGVGTIPAKQSNVSGPSYAAHELGYAYDWENMPLNYYYGYTDAQAEAVATLVYDMATMSRVSFGVSGSSAYDNSLLNGLKSYMKYDKGAYFASKAQYSESGWIQLLKDILDNNGPTIYTGDDTSVGGGHTFILDGYDADDRFHFNWGWGHADCYCELTHIIAGPYNLTANQQVVVGLVPDYDGSSADQDALIFVQANGYSGITTTATNIKANVSFECKVGAITPQANAFTGRIYLSLFDKDGKFKQDIDLYGGIDLQLPLSRTITYPSLVCRITTTIQPGDRIKVRYVGQNNGGVINTGAGCSTEIIVMAEGGGDDPDPDPTAGYTAAQTASSTSLSYDKASRALTLTFAHPANWWVKNTGGTTLDSGTAAEGGAVVIDLSGYSSGTYTIAVGSTEDPFSFTITK